MARSVWENKYARKTDEGFQTWSERVSEVVDGNFLLDPRSREEFEPELAETLALAQAGVMPFSGRHLQHGDLRQADKIGEVFTNCSTAMFSFIKFWLLLKGSGVGRCYDSDICRVNWDFMPNTRFVIDEKHPDWQKGIESLAEAEHKYDSESEEVRWFEVEDSGEGWVKVVEALETAAAQEKHANKLFIFNFSQVRCKGTPIKGQQGRPASGPVPFMQSLEKVTTIKGAGMKPWKQALFIDHYLSKCVAVGGIRRSARIATKSWRDKDVIEFIDIKRVESELAKMYTANNSVSVDSEFWEQAAQQKPSHARRVFEAAVGAAYFDQTGEPGFLNVDRLTNNETGLDRITVDNYLSQEMMEKLELHDKTLELIDHTLRWAKKKRYKFIVNPCGEIVLSIMGGYCVIGDICMSNVEDRQEALDAARLMAKFLMRVNRMPTLYASEVERTNRIGVGLTGIHEFAYKQFGLTFWDMLNLDKSFEFWAFVSEMRRTVEQSAVDYAEVTKVAIPHTFTTMKPSGTVSKVMDCTEGAHLSAMPYYMRWVQYSLDDPAVQDHKDRGYPVKDVSKQYVGHCVIGFPTKMPIADLMGDDLTTAADVTPIDQYTWLRLLEMHWLGGDGKNNQVSYTLKYDPEAVNYYQFTEMILENQPLVRACSVMPQINESAYAYVPEEALSREQYDKFVSGIDRFAKEAVDSDRIDCDSGACPIEPNINT
jgi:adenosylcobalamin-dependent ribonucleoside-triphosphate reductase